MNDGILSQTFNGENPKKIEVRMYIQSVETRAACLSVGSDKELGICQLIFYNGLKGAAMQWFQGLSAEVQDDWQKLKAAFNDKYGKKDQTEQSLRQFYQGIQTLKQENQTLQQYISQANQLATLIDGEPDRNLLCFLAQSFINRISNEYH